MDQNKISQLLSSFFDENFFKALDNIDAETLAPIAALLGLKSQTLVVIIRLLPRMLRGEIDIKDAVPSLLPALLSYMLSLNAPEQNTAAAEASSAAAETVDHENLKFVSGDDLSPLDVYLQSESAS